MTMKSFKHVLTSLIFLVMGGAPGVAGGTDSTGHEDLSKLVEEALVNNPEIQAAIHEMGRSAAVVPQATALDAPILVYEREEMPGFRLSEPMVHKIALMQDIRFPTKLGKEGDLAEIRAEHAHHVHLEKVNEVIARLKVFYYDLWYVQQLILLNRETARLLHQFAETARAKYRVGEREQADVLKAHVEIARADNRLIELRQEEQSAKAMLVALLNREEHDTLGLAMAAAEAMFEADPDALVKLALRNRPMLVHDSLAIREKQLMVSLAQQEYLPDLTLGVEYVNKPVAGFDGWTLRAGISLPFAPWALGKTRGRAQEATADLSQSESLYKSSENMVISGVRDLCLQAVSARDRLAAYRASIIPQARQAFEASLASYQTGRADFLMVIDSYRMLVELSEEALMIRWEFERVVAELERMVGLEGVARI
jgi:outer membrane protein TolC